MMGRPNMKNAKVNFMNTEFSTSAWFNTKMDDNRPEAHQAKNEIVRLIEKYDIAINIHFQKRDEKLSPSEWELLGKINMYRNLPFGTSQPVGDVVRNIAPPEPKVDAKPDLDWDDV
jgi:hypothetical protein